MYEAMNRCLRAELSPAFCSLLWGATLWWSRTRWTTPPFIFLAVRFSAGGGPKNGGEPQERISLEDCIRAYTSGSAYAQFEEGKKGELKPGEYAGFIILSNDLTKVPPAQFTKTRVLRTVVASRTV